MKQAVLSQRHVLILVTGLAFVSSFLPTGVSQWLWSRPRYVKDLLLAPLCDPLHALSMNVRPRAGSSTAAGSDAALEVGRSRNYLRKLESELKEAREKLAQYERVSSLARAGLLNLRGLDLVWARVTGWSGPPDQPVLIINRGRKDGLTEGLAVTDGVNLVGTLQSVGPVTSGVVLVSAARASLEVRIVPPTLEAPTRELPGYLQYDGKRKCFYLVAPKQTDVRAGDLAHLTGGGWPDEAKGLVVGAVVAVEPDVDPHFSRVIVQPAADMRYLQRVVILVPVEESSPQKRAAAAK